MSSTRTLLIALLLALGPHAVWAKKAAPTPTDTPVPTPTPVSVIDQKLYTFEAMWGTKGTSEDQLNAPEDIDITTDGKMVIADTGNNRILIWDPNGSPLKFYGGFGTSATWRNPPQFNRPCAVLVLPSKKIYVADTNNHRIVVLDDKGLVVSSWGTQGPAGGQFNLPRSIARDHFGKILVLDSGNSRVEVFSPLGEYQSTWGAFGDPTSNTSTALMNLPLGMAVNNIDQALVSDTGNFRLQVFNDGGKPVTMEGWFGDGPAQFKEPAGVAITKNGVIAVADGLSGRVAFYNHRFEYIGQWRAKDDILDANFNPRFRGIAVDNENRLYLTDIQSHAILRLKPMKALEALAPPRATPTPLEANPYGGVGFPIR